MTSGLALREASSATRSVVHGAGTTRNVIAEVWDAADGSLYVAPGERWDVVSDEAVCPSTRNAEGQQLRTGHDKDRGTTLLRPTWKNASMDGSRLQMISLAIVLHMPRTQQNTQHPGFSAHTIGVLLRMLLRMLSCGFEHLHLDPFTHEHDTPISALPSDGAFAAVLLF